MIRLLLALLLLIAPAGARAATRLPIEVEQNLVIVEARVGASGPLHFLVDTGASSSVIARDRLAETGLSAGGRTGATAQGGEIEAETVRGAVIRLGAIEIAPRSIAAIDLSGLSAGLGRRIDGIVGRELFEAWVVTIDYDTRRMTLFAPRERPRGRRAIAIELREGTPFVAATLRQGRQRVAAPMLIDTGATGAATIYADLVAGHSWLLPRTILPLSAGALLPGQFRAAAGRLARLSFGGVAVARPVVNFSASAGADDAAESAGGQIGGEILSRYVVTIDYARRRLTLTPGRRLGEPYRFDASGASFAAEPPDFEAKRVRTVLPATPAAEAGLERGDRLLAVDGVPAAALPLSRLRAMLREPGRAYRLEVERGGRRLEATLRTRTLL